MADGNGGDGGGKLGTIGWFDLTVEDAPGVRDFYRSVLGWEVQEISMGDYSDYVMASESGTPVAGVCHARGGNTGLPATWLAYVYVADLDAALDACRAGGGAVVVGPKAQGESRYAIVRDPAGAHLGLYQEG